MILREIRTWEDDREEIKRLKDTIAKLTEESERLNKELAETRTWLSELREEQESQESLDHFAKTLCDILHTNKLKTAIAACRMELDEARGKVEEAIKYIDERPGYGYVDIIYLRDVILKGGGE